jgi:hypothetical protein
MTGMLKVHPFFCVVVESCSCPLCVVTGTHATAYPKNVLKNIQKFEHQLGTKIFKQYELLACKLVKKFAKFTKF